MIDEVAYRGLTRPVTNVVAIVLAAGRGTRFGETPKLLAGLDGKPLVRHVVEAALASRAAPVLVVVGHRAAEVVAAIDGLAVTTVLNPLYAEGLATSLQAGFAALPPGTEAAIVLLADMPRVTSGLMDRLAALWDARGRPDAVVPTFRGRRGNPVLLSIRLASEIADLAGDTGAGPLLRDREGIVELPLDDDAVVLDVDTPAALDAIAAQASTTPLSTAE